MIAPSGGEVRLGGDSLVGRAPEDVVTAGIAHVPEGRRLFAGLTVRENLQVGAYARGGKADIERAVGLFPRLGERLDQVAGSMSGGEQQMCAIARGLMAEPKLIMIDELSLGLAPNLVEQILERLTSVTEAGTAVLLVEQDVDAALEVAARGYVLENGRIVAVRRQRRAARRPPDPRGLPRRGMSAGAPARVSDMSGLMLGAAGMFAAMYSSQAILPELASDFDVTPSQAGLDDLRRRARRGARRLDLGAALGPLRPQALAAARQRPARGPEPRGRGRADLHRAARAARAAGRLHAGPAAPSGSRMSPRSTCPASGAARWATTRSRWSAAAWSGGSASGS